MKQVFTCSLDEETVSKIRAKMRPRVCKNSPANPKEALNV